jgi:hypothetical protein
MKLRKRIDWKHELNEIVTRNNGTSSRRPNAVSAYATQKKRRENLFSAFTDLRTLGYKLESVRNIKPIIGCYSGSPQQSKADGGKAEIERPSPNDVQRKSAGRGLALSKAEMEDAH